MVNIITTTNHPVAGTNMSYFKIFNSFCMGGEGEMKAEIHPLRRRRRECYLCFENYFGEPFELYRYKTSDTLRCLILECY